MPEEVKPGDVSKDDTFNYKRDSVKSIRQIGKETADRIKKSKVKKEEKEDGDKVVKKDEEVEEKPQKEDLKEKVTEDEKPKEPKKPKVDPEELAQKAATEAAELAATRVAEEQKATFQSEVEKILDNKEKTLLEKQKDADELVASWDKENRLPKDYPELISETMRISEAKMAQKMKAIKEEETAKRETELKLAKEKEEAVKKEEASKVESYNTQIAQDLDDLYTAKMLPRPADINEVNNPNTTDEAAKKTQKVFQFGIELNKKLVEAGKPPVTSLAKIYFLHYKQQEKSEESDQPAGADAPISGARNTPTGGDSAKGYVYARDHNKSWAQMGKDLVRKAINK